MNQTIGEGKWAEFKGEIQKAWGKITGDELEQTKGDVKSIGGIIEQRYGMAKEEAQQKIADIASRFHDKADQMKQNAEAKQETKKY